MEWDEFRRQYVGEFPPTMGPALKSFMDEWEGSILCGCDHGCNQWLVRNAAKMFYISKQLLNGDRSKLEEMAQEHPEVFAKRLYQDNRPRRKISAP